MTALIWYAAITSACAALGALAAESLLRQFGRPVRWAWVAALALAVALPALAPLRRAAAPPPVTDLQGLATVIASLPSTVVHAAPKVSVAAGDAMRLGWLFASALAALALVGVHARYRRVRATWTSTTIGGEPVLVSADTGPAVMGLVRPDIVVPHWLLARGDVEQRIVVAHEREHLRARDPVLLTGALLAVVLMPWNPAVWWMLARLRLAVELDCDARVLRAGTLPFVYGNLLIDVAALTAGHQLPALALLNPPSHLQRRLIAMHPDRIRFPRVRGAVLAAAATVALLAACEAAMPTDADVASLDAGKATRAAREMGVVDSVEYIVDGLKVSRDVAMKVKADEIERAEVRKADASAVAGTPSRVILDTKRAAEERGYVERKASGEKGAGVVTLRPSRRSDASDTKVKTKLDMFTGLLFIDGKEVSSSNMLETVGRLDIASVEVLKGDAARQLYGERAAAGVIKITTKK